MNEMCNMFWKIKQRRSFKAMTTYEAYETLIIGELRIFDRGNCHLKDCMMFLGT